MSGFEFHQCSDPTCGLRIPLDPAVHRGEFCPSCGAGMTLVAVAPEYAPEMPRVDAPKREPSVILDNVRSAYNVGAIFRTADGVGAEHLYLCGLTPTPDGNPAIAKTALGAEKTLAWSYHPNSLRVAQTLRRSGCRLLALERTTRAIPLHHWRAAAEVRAGWALIVGNEKAGVDPGLLDLCEQALTLPMRGSKGSLNVAVAFGAAAYWLSFIEEESQE